MLSKSVNNGPCIIFYDTRVCTSTCEIKRKPYKYINIKTPKKEIKNVKDLGLTNEIHINEETIEENLDEIKI